MANRAFKLSGTLVVAAGLYAASAAAQDTVEAHMAAAKAAAGSEYQRVLQAK